MVFGSPIQIPSSKMESKKVFKYIQIVVAIMFCGGKLVNWTVNTFGLVNTTVSVTKSTLLTAHIHGAGKAMTWEHSIKFDLNSRLDSITNNFGKMRYYDLKTFNWILL